MTLFAPIYPELCMLAAGALAVFVGISTKREAPGAEYPNSAMPFIAGVGAILAMFFLREQWQGFFKQGGHTLIVYGESIAIDPYSTFAGMIIVASAFLASVASAGYAKRAGFDCGEYYGLLMFSAAGLMFLVKSNNWVMFFLSLELASLPMYVLSAIARNRAKSTEAGMRYFILGAFGSALVIFGIAFIFGATGSIYVESLAVLPGMGGIYLVGACLLAAGLAFKAGLVPFHAWVPDAYEGAPAPVSAFMSTAAKAAAFVVLVKLTVFGSTYMSQYWEIPLCAFAALSIIVGNLMALTQSNFKRMLAYSSIAHGGYVLVGVIALFGTKQFLATSGLVEPFYSASVLFYLAAYLAMNFGAFALAAHLGKEDGDLEEISSYAGLSRKRPLAAAAMALFMLSLAGIPVTGGFIAKFLVFRDAIQNGYLWLAIVGIAGSLLSVYYYLRVVVMMYMHKPAHGEEFHSDPAEWGMGFVIAACVAGVLILGVMPGWLVNAVTDAARVIFNR